MMPKPPGNERSHTVSEPTPPKPSAAKKALVMLQSLVTALLIFVAQHATAGPKAELWETWTAHDPQSTAQIDHSPWQQFLNRYLLGDTEPRLLRYAAVTEADKSALDAYLSALQQTPIAEYSRQVQKAYWINFYNAATVQLILDNWPVASITKIKPHLFAFGPWDMKQWSVMGEELSLNDIEHRILRPIWQDPRIHYAVNCASLGCPSLAPQAYTADELDAMLDASAKRFVNAPRGVRFEDGELFVSTIYKWFRDDFGGSEAQVIEHLRQYAEPPLEQSLSKVEDIDDYGYDWSINAATSP